MKNSSSARVRSAARRSTRSGLACCYVTCSDRVQARRLGRALLAERLVACVNLIAGMESLYWWRGKVCSAREVVMIAKTRTSLVSALSRRIEQLHGYEVPCIMAIEVLKANASYAAWITDEAAAPGLG